MNINKGIISVIIVLVLIIFLVLFYMLMSRIPPFVSSGLNKAEKKFEKGDFDNAYKIYGELKTKNPNLPEANYGFSNAAYKIDKYNESEIGYKQSAEAWKADKDKLFKSTYNLGNVKYRQGKLQEALDVYKKAMDMDPGDEDAKYNYEFVKRKIKEMEKSQEQRQEKKEKEEKEEKEQRTSEGGQEARDEARLPAGRDQEQDEKEEKEQRASEEGQEVRDETCLPAGRDKDQQERDEIEKKETEDQDKKDLAILGVLEEEEEKARKEYFRGGTQTIVEDEKNW